MVELLKSTRIQDEKKKNLLPEQEKKFIEGAVAKGHTAEHAKEIAELIKEVKFDSGKYNI